MYGVKVSRLRYRKLYLHSRYTEAEQRTNVMGGDECGLWVGEIKDRVEHCEHVLVSIFPWHFWNKAG